MVLHFIDYHIGVELKLLRPFVIYHWKYNIFPKLNLIVVDVAAEIYRNGYNLFMRGAFRCLGLWVKIMKLLLTFPAGKECNCVNCHLFILHDGTLLVPTVLPVARAIIHLNLCSLKLSAWKWIEVHISSSILPLSLVQMNFWNICNGSASFEFNSIEFCSCHFIPFHFTAIQ